MQSQLNDTQANELRRLSKEVSDAVEARINGESGAVERLRRATQNVQIHGMGQFEYWTSQVWQPLKNICLIIAQESKVLPTINDANGSITAAEVAAQTNADELLIVRIMRVLTSVGVAEEVGRSTYKSNDLSLLAASKGGNAGVKFTNELLFSVAAKLVPYMREHGLKQFPQRPHEMDLVQYAFDGRTMFEYLKDTPNMKLAFDTLMSENRKGNRPWFEIYPFGDRHATEPGVVVDIGGNRGADLLDLRDGFPEFPGRLILQDLPETVAHVDEASMKGIEIQPYDFFAPQLVKGADIYFWRWVLHDFDDSSVRKFLPNTVSAMNKDSRLLLMELVLPDRDVDIKGSHLDILMMLYHSGMERSLSQWTEVLDSCGLDIIHVWSRPDTDPRILECKLKVP